MNNIKTLKSKGFYVEKEKTATYVYMTKDQVNEFKELQKSLLFKILAARQYNNIIICAII